MSDKLTAGQTMDVGAELRSANGRTKLVMQGDGNLVLYRTDNGRALWASNTAGKPVNRAVMQGDGNFVCYDAHGKPYFATGTNGHQGSYIVLQDDGNLVVYQGAVARWASNTVQDWTSGLICRARMKRWTSIPFAGSKGDDLLVVNIPPGAKLKSVLLAPIHYDGHRATASTPVGASIGSFYSGVRIEKIVESASMVAVHTHWWFNAFSDAEYSVSVWVEGPGTYPEQMSEQIQSANIDAQVKKELNKWLREHGSDLAKVVAEVAVLIGSVIGGDAPTATKAGEALAKDGPKLFAAASQ